MKNREREVEHEEQREIGTRGGRLVWGWEESCYVNKIAISGPFNTKALYYFPQFIIS